MGGIEQGTDERITDLVRQYDDGEHHVVVVDATTLSILAFSDAAPEAIGMPRDEVVGTPALDLIHPDDLGRAAEALEAVLTHHGPRPPGMYRIKTAQGYRPMAVATAEHESGGLEVIVYTLGEPDDTHRAESLAADQVEIMEMRSGREPLDVCLSGLVALAERHGNDLVCAVTVLSSDDGLVDGFVVAGNRLSDRFVDRRRRSTTASLPPAVEASLARDSSFVSTPAVDPEQFDPRDGHDFARCVTSVLTAADGELLGFIEGFDDGEGSPTHAEWNLHSLIARLASLFIDQTRFEQRLAHAASHDPLTGLANRRMLTEELQRLAESERGYALAMVDLDQFAWINNNFGHHFGDDLLIETGRRLSAAFEERVLVSRPGGDEFVVCLPGFDELGHGDAATRVRSALSEIGTRLHAALRVPLASKGPQRHIRASIGLVAGAPGEDPDRVLHLADAAMYEAKRAGGDAVHIPDAAHDGSARHRHDLRRSLNQALAENRLDLVFQPMVSLETGRVHGIEALVRWEIDRQVVASPEEFVAIAEQSDLILGLDEWVIRRAGRQLLEWRTDGVIPDSCRLWVNVSPRTAARRDLTALLLDAVGPDLADAFGIEITERMVHLHPDRIVESLRNVRAAGFAVALDDFGTGYGSLQHLAQLSLTDLKIDGAFVARMLESEVYESLVVTMIALAHRLGLRVTAEAIETENQRRFLASAGCDIGQGYLFFRPAPGAEIAALGLLAEPAPHVPAR